MDQKKTGTLLRSLRLSKGLTQQQVADLLFLSPKTISKWENGDGLPDITIISSVAELYQVTVDDLLNGKVQQSTNNEIATPHKTAIRSFMKRIDWALYSALGIQIIGLIIGFIVMMNSIEIGIIIISLLYIVGIAIMVIGYSNHKHSLDFEENQTVIDAYHKANKIISYRLHNFVIFQVVYLYIIFFLISSNGITSEIYFNPVPDLAVIILSLFLTRKLISLEGKVLLEKKLSTIYIALMAMSVPLLFQGFNADFQVFMGHDENSIIINRYKLVDLFGLWFNFDIFSLFGILGITSLIVYISILTMFVFKKLRKFEWLVISNLGILVVSYLIFYDLNFTENVVGYGIYPSIHFIAYFICILISLIQIRKQNIILSFLE